MNNRKFIREEKLSIWIFLFYGVIAAALLAPIASQTDIPSMADFINHLGEIIQAKAALASGQFPLRIAPLWSYPIYQFYSPSTYLVAGLIYWLITPTNPLIAYQLITWISLVLGGVYLSRVAYWFTGVRVASILAGVVYMTAPYNIISHFRIGDLNEGVALGVLPVVLFYTLHYFTRPLDQKNLLKMVLAYYFLITTHLVTAIYFTLFVGIFLFCIAVKNKRYLKHLLSVGIGYAWGGLLACWFLAPVFFLEKFLNISNTYQTTDNLTHFNPVLASLFSTASLVTIGLQSAVATLHPTIGLPILLGVGVATYAYFNQRSSGNKRADYWLPALLIVFAITFFCAWSPINFWQWVPTVFRVAQYSWRLLGQVMWVGAILFAWSIAWVFKNQLDKRHILVGAFLIMMGMTPWVVSPTLFRVTLADFTHHPFLVYNNNAYLIDYDHHSRFVSEVNSIQLAVSDFQNLNAPLNIPYPLLKIADHPEIVLQGKIAPDLGNKKYEWIALANHQQLAKGSIAPGNFHWSIPLPALTQLPVSEDMLLIQMVLMKEGKRVATWMQNPIEKATLKGFIGARNILSLNDTRKLCHQKGSTTLCDIFVTDGMKTVELPAYYYPDLYDVKINGQSVSYRGVLDENSLLVGVTPKAGHNEVSIRFRGLVWANMTSFVAWVLWLVYGIVIFIRKK